jgi:hypothetical protein
MPVRKFTCPECEAVLRPAKPLPSGKSVKCPKCGATFIVRDEEEEALDVRPADKPAKAGAQAPTKPADEDEEGPGTYAFIKEEEPPPPEEDEDEDEEEEGTAAKKKFKHPDLEFKLDTSIKDPRGPAQAKLIGPSNMLMLVAFVAIVCGVGAVAYGAWPYLFSSDIIDAGKELQGIKIEKQKDVAAGKDKDAPAPELTREEEEKLPPETRAKLEDKRFERAQELWTCIIAGAVLIAYNCVIIVGGVKMQNMESYAWSMVAAIMSLIPPAFPLLGTLVGLIAISTLRSKKVLDGFNYVPPSAAEVRAQRRREEGR